MSELKPVTTITVDELAARIGEVELIDVREDFEWNAGRIAGARHIPLEALPSKAGELDPERPIVFVCRSGSRSAMATAAFNQSGFDSSNLDGGMIAWAEAGHPVEPPAGDVAGPRPDAS